MTFTAFMDTAVFAPAGMDGALIHDHAAPEIERRVTGYAPTADSFGEDDAHFLNGVTGSGGMYATLTDFVAWDRALREHDVLDRASLEATYTRAELNDGTEVDYGLGWRLDTYLGVDRVAHGGSWVGFRTGIARYPGRELTVVVLSNRADTDPDNYIDRISEIYLGTDSDSFVPASVTEHVQRQQRRLPTDDIWWTVNGPDMRWNFKNLHQLFPTVNVYRHGPVRALRSAPLAAIADYPVETPDGEMRLDDFIESEHSTLMGIVVLHEGNIVYERYPRMHDYEMPVYWSVAKALVGTVVRILEERGEINVDWAVDGVDSDHQGNSLFAQQGDLVNQGIARLYEGLKPPALHRYGETDDREDEVM